MYGTLSSDALPMQSGGQMHLSRELGTGMFLVVLMSSSSLAWESPGQSYRCVATVRPFILHSAGADLRVADGFPQWDVSDATDGPQTKWTHYVIVVTNRQELIGPYFCHTVEEMRLFIICRFMKYRQNM
ncbi:hypothetical protein N7507_008522 [Penicillium longicatenatum]|nr:hypothetical protein N7507_008522 [Penicillium longicatenatum]